MWSRREVLSEKLRCRHAIRTELPPALCAAAIFQLSAVCSTSRYAQCGTRVPSGIVFGYLFLRFIGGREKDVSDMWGRGIRSGRDTNGEGEDALVQLADQLDHLVEQH